MTQISNPFQYIADPDKGRPIFNGKLFFGLPDTDPTIGANQKLVRGVQENGNVVSLPQPVATGPGGIPEFEGSVVILDIDGDYSYTVLNRFDAQEYHAETVENPEPGSEEFSGVVAIEPNTLIDGQTTVVLTNLGANESVFYLRTSIGDQGFLQKDTGDGGDYTVTNSTTIELKQSYNAGDVIVARQNDPTGQLIPVTTAINLLVYDTLALAQAAAVSGELVDGDTVTLNGLNAAFDGKGVAKGKVQVTSEANDDFNFFNLNTTLQLSTEENYHRFLNYAENKAVTVSFATVLTIDLNRGTVHISTLTENISNVVFLNQNPNDSFISTVSLSLVQDGTGGRSITWPSFINWPGGVAPTLTATANAIDFFGFTTFDAGNTWLGATYGQDYS